MSVDRWEALRELAKAAQLDLCEPIQTESVWDAFQVAADPANVLALLAERDALAEREGKLRQALRLRSILPLWAPNLSTRIASKCALCGEEWPTHGAESHAPDCLAKEPDGVREEK
jgi:hypothetical protein